MKTARSERYIEVKSRRVKNTIVRNTAGPFWGQTTQTSSSLSPERDCGSKGVNFYIEVKTRRAEYLVPGTHAHQRYPDISIGAWQTLLRTPLASTGGYPETPLGAG